MGREQLAIDWEREARRAKVRERVETAEQVESDERRLKLFPDRLKLDISLSREPGMAEAYIHGAEPELGAAWLGRLVGGCQPVTRRRWRFSARRLDLLACVPKDVGEVALDAAADSVSRALWAEAAGYKPLRVVRDGKRLTARSPRGAWPSWWRLVDVPWNAVLCLIDLKVRLSVDLGARRLMNVRLSGRSIATASWAGTYVRLDATMPELVEELAAHIPGLAYDGPPELGRFRVPALTAKSVLSLPSIRVPGRVADKIRDVAQPVKPAHPCGVPWKLYPFQERDVAVARQIAKVGGGVLLAGDMGAGKTTMALALLLLEDWWPAVIVCPLAAMSAWERQLEEIGRSFHLAIGSVAEDREVIAAGGLEAVIVSYDRLHQFADLIRNGGYKVIVADELQYIRTPTSRRSKTLRSLSSAVPHRVGLTGTPLMNRLTDLLAQGAFLLPGEWPARPDKRDLSDLYVGDPVAGAAAHLGAFMVRRKMQDTGAKLPGASDWRLDVELTGAQSEELTRLEKEARIAAASGDVSTKMHAFTLLHRQRRIVSCPTATGLEGGNPKVECAVDLVERAFAEGRKSVMFFNYRDTLAELQQAMGAAGLKMVTITGSNRPEERKAAELAFHNDDSVCAIAGSLAAMNAAVTLSPTGRQLIYVDASPDLGTMMQSRARIVRLNQTHPVDIITLVAPGSFDARIQDLLSDKRELFARIVDGEEGSGEKSVDTSLDDLLYVLTGER
jgi:hypothetical protein